MTKTSSTWTSLAASPSNGNYQLWQSMESFSQSKILVCVQSLITRLCPLHVHKHGFIEHNRFITISSLRHIVTTNFAATIYRLLCEILLQRSLTRTISRRDIAKIVQISRWFIVSMRCFADISAINRERSEQTLLCRLSFALLLHSIVGCGFALTSYLYWLRYFFPFYTS